MVPKLPEDTQGLFAPESLREIHTSVKRVADQLRYPFARQAWRGQTGSFNGSGVGSSIDFQDHRPYFPGDDIRHINWQAYARTGHYIIKLYREEVRPTLDIVVDVSRSMFLDPAKARRTLQLLFFSMESALQADAQFRVFFLGVRATPVMKDLRAMRSYDLPELAEHPASETWSDLPERLGAVPFRSGAMRVLLSDLLFPGTPNHLLSRLVSNRGRAIIMAPYSAAEAEPDWRGTVEFQDIEDGHRRIQKTPVDLVERYRKTYLRHFDLWKNAARGFDIPLARVPGETPLLDALQKEAINSGALEIWK